MLFSSSLVRKSLLTNFSKYEKEVNISIGRENRPLLHTTSYKNRFRQIGLFTIFKISLGSKAWGNKTKEITPRLRDK